MIYAENAVVVPDSARNQEMRDVVGNKLDNHNSDSLLAFAHRSDDHFHKPSLTHPTLANGIAVTSGASWVLSAGFTEIVPINTITSDFDIHFISIENLDTNATYELWLYAVEVFIGRTRFVKNAAQDGTVNAPFKTALIPANTQIQAKIADSVGGSIADISLFYHEY